MDKLVRRFVIPSTADAVADVVAQITDVSTRAGLTGSDAFRLSVCTAELLNNVVLHAHEQREKYSIELLLHIDPRQIELFCLDQGPRFFAGSESVSGGQTEPGGRGLAIIRSWSDDYRVNHLSRGNMHQLRRARRPQA